MRQEIFRMERVTYVEDEVTQLEDFNLQIYKGEIMGAVPINGHGLPAFLKLLQNNLPLEDGFVFYGEELINSWKKSKKGYNRISVIQNRSCLVERMTVADNIFVIRNGFKQYMIRPSLFRKQLEPFFREIDIDISADSYVEKLSYFERVVVEILRGVIMGHRLIVLNEIGTLISETELRKLHRIMKQYAQRGIAFLYITPHFEETLEICDRTALISYGRVQKIICEAEMKKAMIPEYPEEYNQLVRGYMEHKGENPQRKDVIFEAKKVTYAALNDLNIKIHAGECVVIQSLDHNVFCSMTDLVSGEGLPEKGELLLCGEKIELLGNRDVAVIQELPTKTMIFPEMSYMDNLCFGLYRRIHNMWGDRHIAESIRMEYEDVLGEDVFFMQLEELTEKQKYQLVYMRILLQKPKVVFCIQPFKGADMPHRMFVWEMIRMLLNKGIAVVMLAVNLADSMALAERLIRLDGSGMTMELSQKEFSMLSSAMPWQQLYETREEDTL